MFWDQWFYGHAIISMIFPNLFYLSKLIANVSLVANGFYLKLIGLILNTVNVFYPF